MTKLRVGELRGLLESAHPCMVRMGDAFVEAGVDVENWVYLCRRMGKWRTVLGQMEEMLKDGGTVEVV